MEKFIIIDEQGSAYKCTPEKIKTISEGELSKYANKKKISERVLDFNLKVHENRTDGLIYFLPSAGISFCPEINLHRFTDSKKTIYYTALNQMLFSGAFVPSAYPGKMTLSPFSSVGSLNRDVLMNVTLGWDSRVMKLANDIGMQFIAYMVIDNSYKETIGDMGLNLSRPIIGHPDSSNNSDSVKFDELFGYENEMRTNTPQLYLAAVVNGIPYASFPLLSNIFDDGKVCLGHYYLNGKICSSNISSPEAFSYMVLSFMFSSFNTDLLTTNGGGIVGVVNASVYGSKASLMEKLWLWDIDTMKHSPVITKEEIEAYAADYTVRKSWLDTITQLIAE